MAAYFANATAAAAVVDIGDRITLVTSTMNVNKFFDDCYIKLQEMFLI